MRVPRALALAVLAASLSACGRAEPAPEASGAWTAEPLIAFRASELTAGPTDSSPEPANPYADDSDALIQGRQLYTSFNCAGCHGAAGGGGIGPPLADDDWIYGGSDAQIYASVIQGRPNGMPAFGPMMAGEAVWKLAAYVRSLHQDVPTGVSRRD
ncbi:MAG TPA: c-type cytochrome [Gemmatimonadales bacterium]|jgi:cytochrome c oxidase cbb3-type subunit 3|nr:c-type cytochrome [Gemmatimonadales bacterium]